MVKDEYRTIAEESQGIYKEKGSKFIAIALPVGSTEEVKSNLERLRKQFHDARHHCYAYRIGEEPYEYRYNDDGEPSGTAGKPIYGQIQSFDLSNVLIVVVRYFGGVKLGTGGLIQAYKSAARSALENNRIVNKTWKTTAEIQFDYALMNEVMRIVKEDNLTILSQASNERYSIILEIRKGEFDHVAKKLSSLELLNLTII